MSGIEKLIVRFKNHPKDFSWDELTRLLNHFGYAQMTGSGSRRKFIQDNRQPIILHQPHPRKILKTYQMNQIYDTLKEERFI
jgi:hypothetical protein